MTRIHEARMMTDQKFRFRLIRVNPRSPIRVIRVIRVPFLSNPLSGSILIGDSGKYKSATLGSKIVPFLNRSPGAGNFKG